MPYLEGESQNIKILGFSALLRTSVPPSVKWWAYEQGWGADCPSKSTLFSQTDISLQQLSRQSQ